MRDFDPNRIASEWHSGQGSALYAYASTDRIPTEEFKDRLVSEIEHSMARADDEGLDELEYLLMHVEEQHPDRFPDSEMHEEDMYCEVCGGGKGVCECTMTEVEPRIMRQESSLKEAVFRIIREVTDVDEEGNLGVGGVLQGFVPAVVFLAGNRPALALLLFGNARE